MQTVSSTVDEMQTEAHDEMARLYKVSMEAKLAAVQIETKLLAQTLLTLLDEHPEVTAVGFDINHEYDRRENDYWPTIDFLFWAGDEQIGDDWTYMSEELHGWSREAADSLGDEGDKLTRETLREKAVVS